jgi:hypothetical protein
VKNTRENNLKKEGFIFFTVLEVSVSIHYGG